MTNFTPKFILISQEVLIEFQRKPSSFLFVSSINTTRTCLTTFPSIHSTWRRRGSQYICSIVWVVLAIQFFKSVKREDLVKMISLQIIEAASTKQ